MHGPVPGEELQHAGGPLSYARLAPRESPHPDFTQELTWKLLPTGAQEARVSHAISANWRRVVWGSLALVVIWKGLITQRSRVQIQGRSLDKPFAALNAWTMEHAEALRAAQKAFDERHGSVSERRG
jgi:hypothetical protein